MTSPTEHSMVSIVTPTWNRAHTLPRLYESIVGQRSESGRFADLEWIVVDDGSEDDTEGEVRRWMDAGQIDIRYVRQPNSGKHAAVNRGVELARGRFTSIVDSDDWLAPDALPTLLAAWESIPEAERPSFVGVVGLCCFADRSIVGDRFPTSPLDCDSIEMTYVLDVGGDKQSIMRTDIIRRFPSPFEDVRGWVSEGLVWNRIGLEFKSRHINQVVQFKEYLEGGITDRAMGLMIEAAPANRQFFLEEALLPNRIRPARRLKSRVNYSRFSFHSGVDLREQARDAPSRWAWPLLAPLGWMLYRSDCRRQRAVRTRTS